MTENNQIPEIRFEGFSGEWEEREIVNVAPLQRGFDLPKSEMKVGDYPVVMSNGINGYHSEFKAKAPGVVTGRSGTIGNIHYIDSNYWPHNTSLWVTDFKKNDPLYIYYMYSRLNLNRFGTGSGVPTLNRNDVHDKCVYISNQSEQTKISSYFQKLDTLITLHQRKHDKLLNLKKAMLEKMFPKKGEDIPEIRFKDFSEKWEERKIVNVAPLQRGFDLPKSEMKVGDYPVVMSNGINGYHSEFKAKAPGVVTGRSGTIGNIHYIDSNYWPHNTSLWVTDFKKNDPLYIYYMYSRLNLNRFGTGSGVPTLNRNDVHDKCVYISNQSEQTKIGNFFKNLDTLLTLQQTKLTKLKNIKQACLEKMFV